MGWGMGTGWGMGASEMRRSGAHGSGGRAQPAPLGLTLTPQGQALGTPRCPVPRSAPPTCAGVKTFPVSDVDNTLADSARPSSTAPPNREHTVFRGFRYPISVPGSRNSPCPRPRFLTASWSLLCWEVGEKQFPAQVGCQHSPLGARCSRAGSRTCPRLTLSFRLCFRTSLPCWMKCTGHWFMALSALWRSQSS